MNGVNSILIYQGPKLVKDFWLMDVRIIDENNNDVKPHTVGEIVLRSKTVMVQYWHKPDETRDVMIDGWLHAGDIGYYDQKGYIYLVDRKKDMVVTGGENVYPREVEEVLYRHPAVAEAAIIGVPDELWIERVHSVIVLKEGRYATGDEIMEFCKQHLARYKSQVALEVGFPDQSYFTKVFKKIEKYTPNAFRQKFSTRSLKPYHSNR
jgi:acyl-CoA synthetase (AMP-forming)/AMP-acid ligase II